MLRILLFFLCSMVSASMYAQSSSDSLQKHVETLCRFDHTRDQFAPDVLNAAAQYIHDELQSYSNHTFFQRYVISGEVYRNVIASFGPEKGPRLIIGAHYDAKGKGADDNASGIAALLELARLLASVDSALLQRIDLVAWSGGELPSNKPRNMGSYKHALSLHDAQISVSGILMLESIGYYTEANRSQHYPLFFYKDIHGNQGNFTALYERMGMGSFGMMMKYLFRQYGQANLLSFKPIMPFRKMESNDFRNCVHFDFPTLLISDTGKYRNKNLHTTFDTPETLNYIRMRAIVDMVFQSVIRYKE